MGVTWNKLGASSFGLSANTRGAKNAKSEAFLFKVFCAGIMELGTMYKSLVAMVTKHA
jgi:hypothetical protein